MSSSNEIKVACVSYGGLFSDPVTRIVNSVYGKNITRFDTFASARGLIAERFDGIILVPTNMRVGDNSLEQYIPRTSTLELENIGKQVLTQIIRHHLSANKETLVGVAMRNKENPHYSKEAFLQAGANYAWAIEEEQRLREFLEAIKRK